VKYAWCYSSVTESLHCDPVKGVLPQNCCGWRAGMHSVVVTAQQQVANKSLLITCLGLCARTPWQTQYFHEFNYMVWQIHWMSIGLEVTGVRHAWLLLKNTSLHFKYLKLFVGGEERFLFFWPALLFVCLFYFGRVAMPQSSFSLKGLEAALPRLWLQSSVGLLKTIDCWCFH